MKEYNEENVLTDYILYYYFHLLTKFERDVMQYRIFRIKTGDIDDDYQERLEFQGFTAEDELRLKEYLNDDLASNLFRKATDRVYKEHQNEMLINRCPACSKITRTPHAKQCRYCGHDWH